MVSEQSEWREKLREGACVGGEEKSSVWESGRLNAGELTGSCTASERENVSKGCAFDSNIPL